METSRFPTASERWNWRFWAAVFALAALASPSCSKNDPTAPGVYSLSGSVQMSGFLFAADGRFAGTRVIDDADGVPVELVSGNRVVATTTTVGGRYEFSGLSPWSYRVRARLLDRVVDETVGLTIAAASVVSRDTLRLDSFGDLQPVPNPTAPATTIYYSLPVGQRVDVRVRDLLGRTVRVLFDEERPAGLNQIWWDGLDRDGQPLAAPLHWVTLESSGGLRAHLLFR